jgi:hypothetical protein
MIGIGVNLYIKVPGAAHSIGDAISKGPAALALHVVLGLLLVVAAVGLVVQTAIARDRILLAPSIVGLIALILAVVSGVSFVDKGQASASLAMAIFTGVALLAYGTNPKDSHTAGLLCVINCHIGSCSHKEGP